jgi:hypothetical protein
VTKVKLTARVAPDIARRLEDLAARRGVPQAAIMEAAIASHLSPDGADRREAAFVRRLDRLTRQMERLQRDTTINGEAIALFVRFWLSVTPQLPEQAQAAARAKGAERYAGFVDTLGRRLQQGKSLAREVSKEIDPGAALRGAVVDDQPSDGAQHDGEAAHVG